MLPVRAKRLVPVTPPSPPSPRSRSGRRSNQLENVTCTRPRGLRRETGRHIEVAFCCGSTGVGLFAGLLGIQRVGEPSYWPAASSVTPGFGIRARHKECPLVSSRCISRPCEVSCAIRRRRARVVSQRRHRERATAAWCGSSSSCFSRHSSATDGPSPMRHSRKISRTELIWICAETHSEIRENKNK